MNHKSKNLTAAGLGAESPIIPGLTRKEAWDRLIATREPVNKDAVLKRIKEASAKK